MRKKTKTLRGCLFMPMHAVHMVMYVGLHCVAALGTPVQDRIQLERTVLAAAKQATNGHHLPLNLAYSELSNRRLSAIRMTTSFITPTH